MHAVAFSLVVTAHHPEFAGVLMAFSSLIASSRIILGLHYPTDVVAGGLIGGYVASVWLTPKFKVTVFISSKVSCRDAKNFLRAITIRAKFYLALTNS